MKVIVFGDKLFSVDMAWGFEELGHMVVNAWPKTIQELDVLLTEENPDLLITLGSPAYFNSELLRHLGDRTQTKMKCVHWDTDGITWKDIETKHMNLLKPDMVFTVCPEMLELLRNRGIPSEILFYAFSPIMHRPEPIDVENTGQIAFAGSAYPNVISRFPDHYRRRSMDVLFKPLLDGGYRIDFYGDNRHQQVIKKLYDFDVPASWLHGRCPYEKTGRIYSGYSINLVTQNNENSLTKRVFEILGSGGFALSYENSAVRKLFTPGKDLVVSAAPKQTPELVGYYANHPEEYKSIRENALLSAQNHTYKQRAKYILSKLEPV